MPKTPKVKHEHAITMRKRPARRAGEIGLFPDNEMASEDFIPISQNTDLSVHVSNPVERHDLNWCWALANLIAKSDDRFSDSADAMDFLKVKARHYRAHENELLPGRVFYVPRSLTEFDGVALKRFRNRLVWIVIHELLPGMKETELTKEIERMIAGSPRAAA